MASSVPGEGVLLCIWLLAKILSREILLHNLCKVRPSWSRFLSTLPPQKAGGGKWSSLAVFPWGSWVSSSASCCHSLDNWSVTVHSPSAFCVQPQGKSSTGKHRAHPSVLAGLPSFLGVLSSQALGLWPEKTQLHLLYPQFHYSSAFPTTGQEGTDHSIQTAVSNDSPHHLLLLITWVSALGIRAGGRQGNLHCASDSEIVFTVEGQLRFLPVELAHSPCVTCVMHLLLYKYRVIDDMKKASEKLLWKRNWNVITKCWSLRMLLDDLKIAVRQSCWSNWKTLGESPQTFLQQSS